MIRTDLGLSYSSLADRNQPERESSVRWLLQWLFPSGMTSTPVIMKGEFKHPRRFSRLASV